MPSDIVSSHGVLWELLQTEWSTLLQFSSSKGQGTEAFLGLFIRRSVEKRKCPKNQACVSFTTPLQCPAARPCCAMASEWLVKAEDSAALKAL